MTESEIQFLKENIDKLVEIETIDGERLVAKVVLFCIPRNTTNTMCSTK